MKKSCPPPHLHHKLRHTSVKHNSQLVIKGGIPAKIQRACNGYLIIINHYLGKFSALFHFLHIFAFGRCRPKASLLCNHMNPMLLKGGPILVIKCCCFLLVPKFRGL